MEKTVEFSLRPIPHLGACSQAYIQSAIYTDRKAKTGVKGLNKTRYSILLIIFFSF